MVKFTYDAAFERNVGWLTEAEQLALRGMRIALAGMGGVGGVHMITLARLGVGAFNIADFDRFDIPNFNRQYGCNVNTIDLVKSDVMAEMALAVNPELRIRRFDEGVTDENLERSSTMSTCSSTASTSMSLRCGARPIGAAANWAFPSSAPVRSAWACPCWPSTPRA